MMTLARHASFLFFFNYPAPTELYTLSLHDALPISWACTSSRAKGRSSTARCARPRTLRSSACPIRKAHCRSEEHTSELQSHVNLVCRLLLEKKKITIFTPYASL